MQIGYHIGMDVDQLRQDVAEGTVELDRLVDLIASQQKLIQQLQEDNEKLQEQRSIE